MTNNQALNKATVIEDRANPREGFAGLPRFRRCPDQRNDAFLADLEHWRDLLARNIALRNKIAPPEDQNVISSGVEKSLTQRELNCAVQITIVRIIFLRIREERGIEAFGRLRTLANGTNIYARLQHLFHQAGERDNSGLVCSQPEPKRMGEAGQLKTTLEIDDLVSALYGLTDEEIAIVECGA